MENYLTPAELQEKLNISQQTYESLLGQGMPCVKLSHKPRAQRRFDLEKVTKWLETRTVEGGEHTDSGKQSTHVTPSEPRKPRKPSIKGRPPSKLDNYRDEILESLRQGVSKTDIARNCGADTKTLYRWLNNRGIEYKKKQRKRGEDDKSRMSKERDSQ